MRPGMVSAVDRLVAELGAVGERCGFTCVHHAPLVCKRAAGHGQAEAGLMVDMHADLVDGLPVMFDGDCERHEAGDTP